MSSYHLNIFRPYHNVGRDEISVTRALIIACVKSPNGRLLFKKIYENAKGNEGALIKFDDNDLNEIVWEWELEASSDEVKKKAQTKRFLKRIVLCITPEEDYKWVPPWNDILDKYKNFIDVKPTADLKHAIFKFKNEAEILSNSFKAHLKNIRVIVKCGVWSHGQVT